MKNFAFVFPGQGSQTVGMGKNFFDNFEIAQNFYNDADKILNKKISKLCFDGPQEDLNQTQNTQPAILTTSIVALECFKSKINIAPKFVAGHSLGEYAAMYCSKVFDFEATLKLIQKRADLMSESKDGTMAAVLNADENILQNCLKEASKQGYVDVANYNSPAQTVITGEKVAVEKACALLIEKGVKRVIPLAVSGAFHSKLMKPASEIFEKFINDININEAEIPVITNIDAMATVKYFKPKMIQQIYSSVYWYQSIQKMIEEGVDTFIEFGSGKVLTGLIRKINPEVTTFNVSDSTSLNETITKIKEVINE